MLMLKSKGSLTNEPLKRGEKGIRPGAQATRPQASLLTNEIEWKIRRKMVLMPNYQPSIRRFSE